MAQASSSNRRKYPRFDVNAKVRYKKLQSKNDSNAKEEGLVKNISAEGFCFYSNNKLEQGELLEVEIEEADVHIDPLRVKAEVVWCSDNPPASGQSMGFIIGVKLLGVKQTDEARFAMLYCERMLDELKNFLKL